MRLCEVCCNSRATKRAGTSTGQTVLLCAACATLKHVTLSRDQRAAAATRTKGPPPIDSSSVDESMFSLAFRALMAKSFAIQRRQIGTNVVQVLIPIMIILLLFLLQLLVTSIVQSRQGKVRDANPLPRTSAPQLLIPLFDDANSCSNSSFEVLPLRILTSGIASDVVGFRPRVDNDTLRFFETRVAAAGAGGGGGGGSRCGIVPAASSTATTLSTTLSTTTAVPTPMTTRAASAAVSTGILGNLSANPIDWQALRGRNVPAEGNRRERCFNKVVIGVPDVEPFEELSDIEAEMITSWFAPNRSVLAGIDFSRAELNRNGTSRIDYNLLYNATLTRGVDVAQLYNLITNAIYRLVTGGTGKIVFQGVAPFPTPRAINDFDLQSLIAPILYVYTFQLLLPVFVVSLVSEREVGLVQIMRQSGLPDRVYALVTYIFFLILYVAQTGIVILLAAILRFRYFIANDIGIVLLFFFVWGNCLIAVSFLFSVFFSKGRTGTIVMYLWVFITGILASNLVANFFSSADTPAAINNALMIVPTFVMFRGLLDLSKLHEQRRHWHDVERPVERRRLRHGGVASGAW
jgi:hypothetical protein